MRVYYKFLLRHHHITQSYLVYSFLFIILLAFGNSPLYSVLFLTPFVLFLVICFPRFYLLQFLRAFVHSRTPFLTSIAASHRIPAATRQHNHITGNADDQNCRCRRRPACSGAASDSTAPSSPHLVSILFILTLEPEPETGTVSMSL